MNERDQLALALMQDPNLRRGRIRPGLEMADTGGPELPEARNLEDIGSDWQDIGMATAAGAVDPFGATSAGLSAMGSDWGRQLNETQALNPFMAGAGAMPLESLIMGGVFGVGSSLVAKALARRGIPASIKHAVNTVSNAERYAEGANKNYGTFANMLDDSGRAIQEPFRRAAVPRALSGETVAAAGMGATYPLARDGMKGKIDGYTLGESAVGAIMAGLANRAASRATSQNINHEFKSAYGGARQRLVRPERTRLKSAEIGELANAESRRSLLKHALTPSATAQEIKRRRRLGSRGFVPDDDPRRWSAKGPSWRMPE